MDKVKYVSYWMNNEDIGVYYGSKNECIRFIDIFIGDMVLNQTSYKLIDYTPQDFN